MSEPIAVFTTEEERAETMRVLFATLNVMLDSQNRLITRIETIEAQLAELRSPKGTIQ